MPAFPQHFAIPDLTLPFQNCLRKGKARMMKLILEPERKKKLYSVIQEAAQFR